MQMFVAYLPVYPISKVVNFIWVLAVSFLEEQAYIRKVKLVSPIMNLAIFFL